MKWSIEGKITVWFGLAFLILVLIVAVSYRNTIKLIETDRMVAHTHEVLGELGEILFTIEEAVSNQRGYIVTMEESYLNLYQAALRETGDRIEHVKLLTSDNPHQQARVSSLKLRISARYKLLQDVIDVRKKDGLDAAVRLISTGDGRKEMGYVQNIIDQMAQEERRLLEQREKEAKTSARNTFFTLLIAALFHIGLFSIFYYRIKRDITERKEAEKALRASETQTRSIIENLLGGIITTNDRGIIELVNPSAERIFGYKKEELIGQHLKILMPESLSSNPENFLTQAYSQTIGRVTEWKGRRKNGEIFPFELALFDFNSLEGKRFAGNIRDISERFEVERLKKEFVSTVSHELRTPLTSIRGSLSLLAGGVLGELPEEAVEVISIAERNTIRLIGLINDILDLERLESGKLEMHFEPVKVSTVVERSIEAVRAFAEQGQVEIENKIDAENREAKMYADGDRLVQVLVNLLSNAVKFSPSGNSVTILAEQRGDKIEFSVVDRGRGIPASHRESIFERFKQVEASDSRQKGGTGLGLAICKAIVEQHNGEIGVESEEGKGSTFWFRIPSVLKKPETLKEKVINILVCNEEDQLLGAIREGVKQVGCCDVLLVDDDVALLNIMARQLSQDGIAVCTATTGKEAVLELQKRAPGLLVLDVGLPDGDGFDVVEALRREPNLKSIPLLVYTGRELTDEQRGRLKLGPTRFLTKTKAKDEEFRTLVNDLLHFNNSN